MAAFKEVVVASWPLDGAIHFDISRDIMDPNAFIATEVFKDWAALERQGALPVTQQTIALLGDLLAGESEATIFDVSSSEPWRA